MTVPSGRSFPLGASVVEGGVNFCVFSRKAREDLEEALAFAGDGAVAAHFSWDELENINDIFARMEEGKIDGRIVAKM